VASANPNCDYCRGPLRGEGHAGRPWSDRIAARYCCYGCLSLGEEQRAAEQTGDSSTPSGRFALKIGLGLLVIAQSMILSLGIALEVDTPSHVKWPIHGGLLLANSFIVVLLGRPLAKSAWREWTRRRITIESLFLLTMAGAFASSLYAFLTGRGPVYFEVMSVLLVVYSLGKALGARSRAAAIASTTRWADSLATCRRGGETVAVTEIAVGDRIEVFPGETIAVDGRIVSGTGNVSVSSLTGEPFAVVKRPGDAVLAGFISYDVTFLVEATRPGTQRQVDSLIDAVERARATPVSIQGTADRIVGGFLPLVVLIAVGTFAFWTSRADLDTGLRNAMAVLLVACPCAMGLATPVVVWSALARLAERGFVVRRGDAIERFATVTEIAFDKTGTLTDDRFTLVDIVTRVDGTERTQLLKWFALVENQSPHPIARAFRDATPGVPSPVEVRDFRIVPGAGVQATIVTEEGSHAIRIGRPEWIGSAETLDDHRKEPDAHRVDCEVDGRLAATAWFRERLRDSLPATQAACRQLGLEIHLLTGDTRPRAAVLEIESTHANLLPLQKQQFLEARKALGERPLMVGDGINDAPALASAHVGIALASGTDAAADVADITMHHDDLRAIPWAVALARESMAIVRRNLAIAAGYNLIGMALAAGGQLHPIAAALIMVLSSALVAWSASQVGVSADRMCEAHAETPAHSRIWPAWGHGLALLLQAVIFLQLTRPDPAVAVSLIVAAILWGGFLARRWLQTDLSHPVDMAFGMLTVGNLGMVLGWWADNSFQPFRDTATCDCLEAIRSGVFRPWMWVGMFAFGHLAMTVFAQRNGNGNVHRLAMLTGGNLGMGVGMLLGGWLAGFLPTGDRVVMAGVNLAGMTAGMIVGMDWGTRLALTLFGGRFRRWASDAARPLPYKSPDDNG
jgi:heavy metal translocating P-type ATPase